MRTAAGAHPASAALSTRLTGIGGRPFAIRVSNKGVIAVTQQDLNTLTLTDAEHKAPRSVKVGADPGDVVFNNAGTKAYVSAFNQGTISIIDVAAATVTTTIQVAANAYRLSLTGDEGKLFVTSTDGHVYVINLSSPGTSSLALSGALNGCAIDPSSRYLYVTSTAGRVWKIDASTLTVLATANQGGVGQDVTLSPSGAELYVANEAGWVDVLDASTLASRAKIPMSGAPFGLAVTLDGQFLYVTSPADGTVSIVDIATRAAVKVLRVDRVPRRVAFDASGLTAFVANEGNYVDVIR